MDSYQMLPIGYELIMWAADEDNVGVDVDSMDHMSYVYAKTCIFCEHWIGDEHGDDCLHLRAKAVVAGLIDNP